MAFSHFRQLNKMDCGPTCLRMIAHYYGKELDAEVVRKESGFNKQGVSFLNLSETAEKFGLRARGVQINFQKLQTIILPAILHWEQRHFVVLVSVTAKKVIIADPAAGIVHYTMEEFLSRWLSTSSGKFPDLGIALLLEPGPDFYIGAKGVKKKLSWDVVKKYANKYRWPLVKVFILLLLGMIFQLIFPFLTQSLMDKGIKLGNLKYVTVVLLAQLTLTFSSTFVEFLRSRWQLKISNSISISILSDFWIKLTRLPLSYFDIHRTGDTMQRIEDNKKIQGFLSGQAITMVFSFLTFVVYSLILVYYSANLFFVFAISTVLYVFWISFFLRLRRKINYETFQLSSKENTATLQLVQGMQEIRLNNAEEFMRWDWERIQAKIFRLNFKNLSYGQWQSAGALFITQGKDVIITFLVAKLVIDGTLTLGSMLAIQFILGQLTGPVQQLVGLAQNIQDAKISMERLNEVHSMTDEEPAEKSFYAQLPQNKSLHINRLSFAYPGSSNDAVLQNIDLTIKEGTATAIVGVSGSGKTTLLKLLLKIYNNYQGEIKVGENNFTDIRPSFWRKQCGAVLQDGYIFNDTIERNIAISDEAVDGRQLQKCCVAANITSFIEQLPNGFNTQLGADGVGISQGQRQRILIARAIYKNPHYLFFDEATNALDANNEKAIVDNLNELFKGKTVVVVAHRLSTVKNADNIIVLDKGKIVEQGNHGYLIALKGYYYRLIKNQLELEA